MKYLKNVNTDSSKIYIWDNDGGSLTFRLDYDEETNIISIPFLDEGIQYSGSGEYFIVHEFLSYDDFTVKPEFGEYVDIYRSVEFDAPDGFHFSGYGDYYHIYTGATTSSLVAVGAISTFMIGETPAYASYQCFQQIQNYDYGTERVCRYKEFATDTGAEWIDGDGMYACHVESDGNIWFVTNNVAYEGKWEITEEEVDVYYRRDKIKMRVLTNNKGYTLYYYDLQGTGVPQIFYRDGTYEGLPSVRTDRHILLEKHPKTVNYYEGTVFPGVAYNKETKTVFYNNPNKKLYFVDNGDTSGEVISALTFSELGITVQDVETYIEKIKEGYPADWFNVRVNGWRLQNAEIRDGIITFFYYFHLSPSTGYEVSFNISDESCQFSYLMSDTK